MLHTEQQVHKSGLEESLLELVKSRASQINNCAWCLDMRTKDARALGKTEQRLYLLSVWPRGSMLQRSRACRVGLDGSDYPASPAGCVRCTLY